jgi:hypothetical protein
METGTAALIVVLGKIAVEIFEKWNQRRKVEADASIESKKLDLEAEAEAADSEAQFRAELLGRLREVEAEREELLGELQQVKDTLAEIKAELRLYRSCPKPDCPVRRESV